MKDRQILWRRLQLLGWSAACAILLFLLLFGTVKPVRHWAWLLCGTHFSVLLYLCAPLALIALVIAARFAWHGGDKGRAVRLTAYTVLLALVWCRVAGFHLEDAIDVSKRQGATGDIEKAFNPALALYREDVRDQRFPLTSLHQLYSDGVAGWSGPYLATITTDPWDNRYAYTCDGSNYTIQSVHATWYGVAETIRYVFSNGKTEQIP